MSDATPRSGPRRARSLPHASWTPFRASTLLAVIGWLALAGSPARATVFTLAGAADTVTVSPGATFTLDLVVRGPSPPFNGFDLRLHFDPARLVNTPLSPLSGQVGALMTSACATNPPFHMFTPAADSLTCTVVILCSGVTVTGPGTLYRVQFTAAPVVDSTKLWFGPATAFYAGGPRVDTLACRPIVVRIGDPRLLGVGAPPPRADALALDPVAPNPGRRIGALGVSFRLPRAEVAEVSLLDLLGRRVARSGRAPFGAGAQRVTLRLPRLAPGRYTVALRTGSGGVRTRPWVVLR